ncbi:MAG: hypothetical protein SH856_09555 [Flavobacteriales bacterium]|nr:hypothetical protein [Flavobacteriales bacterium]
MKSLSIVLAFVFVLAFASCKKFPGEGGNSSIKGMVEKDVRLVLTNPGTHQYTVAAAEIDVYISYGDNISPDDRVWTNFDGEFEFLNLREGDYTIYVYSMDTTGVSGVDAKHMVIKQDVEITSKKQVVVVPVMTVYDTQ